MAVPIPCPWRGGLYDELRPGRPRPISDERVAQLVRKTLQTKPPNSTHWSIRQIAGETGVSKSTVHRIWQAFGLQPHGVHEVSISERKCIPLLPGVTSGAIFARDGKSLLYAVAVRGEVAVYRQPWKDSRVIGTPQVALKLPFTFPAGYWNGSSYDFSRDLSTIVYERPGGQADLYLLSQK
jgi:hypothetical protein